MTKWFFVKKTVVAQIYIQQPACAALSVVLRSYNAIAGRHGLFPGLGTTWRGLFILVHQEAFWGAFQVVSVSFIKAWNALLLVERIASRIALCFDDASGFSGIAFLPMTF